MVQGSTQQARSAMVHTAQAQAPAVVEALASWAPVLAVQVPAAAPLLLVPWRLTLLACRDRAPAAPGVAAAPRSRTRCCWASGLVLALELLVHLAQRLEPAQASPVSTTAFCRSWRAP